MTQPAVVSDCCSVGASSVAESAVVYPQPSLEFSPSESTPAAQKDTEVNSDTLIQLPEPPGQTLPVPQQETQPAESEPSILVAPSDASNETELVDEQSAPTSDFPSTFAEPSEASQELSSQELDSREFPSQELPNQQLPSQAPAGQVDTTVPEETNAAPALLGDRYSVLPTPEPAAEPAEPDATSAFAEPAPEDSENEFDISSLFDDAPLVQDAALPDEVQQDTLSAEPAEEPSSIASPAADPASDNYDISDEFQAYPSEFSAAASDLPEAQAEPELDELLPPADEQDDSLAPERPSTEGDSQEEDDGMSILDDLLGQVQRGPEASPAFGAAFRTWTDRTAQYQCEARLERLTKQGVVLCRADGQHVQIGFGELSSQDLAHLQQEVIATRDRIARSQLAGQLAGSWSDK